MLNPKYEVDESQLHLEAMLYVLEDPALDREAFEARLEDNSQLAEILAEAVAIYHVTRNVLSREPHLTPTVALSLARSATLLSPRLLTTSPNRGGRLVATFATLAASLLVAAILAMQSFQHGNSDAIKLAYANADAASLTKVVLAWGDMQSDLPAFQQVRELLEVESEYNWAMVDPMGESDVPDWLVLATSDNPDSGLELRDGRGLLQ